MKILILLVLLSLYLLWPLPGFPPPPQKSFISNEPADTESVYRTAFYTTLSRIEVMEYYKSVFNKPFIRINHPPEEAQAIIRDQTKSSWLEELVHPFKDSLFINGFYPTKPTEQININGVHYEAKITLHYFPSHQVTRLTVLLMLLISICLLKKEYAKI